MNIRTFQIAIALSLFAFNCFAQDSEIDFPDPPHQVMFLGTFHFADAGLDDYKPEMRVDIESKKRQAELEEVLLLLENYKPTKIVVEVLADRQEKLNGDYQKYLAGKFQLTANEVHQLGFKLAKRLGHESVFAVDAPRRRYSPYVAPGAYAHANGQADLLESEWASRYEAEFKFEDRHKSKTTLCEHLKYLNQPDRIIHSHGQYLINWFKAGRHPDYVGADLQTSWFNRNLRIYSNIARLPSIEKERVLVIIGAGHLPLLIHSANASPEFEVVDPNSFLRASKSKNLDATALIRQHSFEMTHDLKLGGPAMELIENSTTDAQFVLIGEPHNRDQVNRFTSMLFEVLHQRSGFQHLIVEQGPQIMKAFSKKNVSGDVDAIRAIAASHREALHYGTDGELEMLAAVGRISNVDYPIWGVDRIHDASFALKALAEAVPDEKEPLLAMAQTAREQGVSFFRDSSGNLDAILSSLKVDPKSNIEPILHALSESRDDFADWSKVHNEGEPWGYGANLRREELMKSQFVFNYRQAIKNGTQNPKAIAKMGHWHLIRGHNRGSVATLGNLLVETARLNGMNSLSIAIQPVNVPGRDWSIADDTKFNTLTSTADPSKWILVDQRSLRPFVHSGMLKLTAEEKELVFGFDLLLLIGGTNKGRNTWDSNNRPDND